MIEEDKSKNFNPEKNLINIHNEQETLLYLPSKVNCIPFDNSVSIPGILNNFGELIGRYF